MRTGIAFLAIIFAAIVPAGALRAETGEAGARHARLFPRPVELEPAIAFWKKVFAEYSTHQVVLHDAWDLSRVYKVLDFRDGNETRYDVQLDRLERVDVDLEIERLRATLLRLHGLGPNLDPQSLTAEERRVHELFRNDSYPDRFLSAADGKRLRSQRGLRERFAEAIRVSRRYLPEMERIFRAEGLPTELTRLPLIESCFNLRAYSKVGAAGIWQFMPATGRLYMRVDNLVDERRDPIASTRAAAQFLRGMYNALDSWPLAITAYNHGPDGIARAVRAVGSRDIATIIRNYGGSSFGFASRNFYAEFLAALEIERDYKRHFGELRLDPPLQLREHRLDRSVGMEQAARLARTDRQDLATLNPALSSLVVSGRRPIPAGYRLRLPDDGADGFGQRLAALAGEPRVTRVAATSTSRAPKTRARQDVVTVRVRSGQTLGHIAKQHKVSVASLQRTNRLGKAGRLRAGQLIKIPVPQSAM